MQKWDVNGESCCELFAKVPISRGEVVRLVHVPSKYKAKIESPDGGWHVTANCSYNRSLYWLLQLTIAASDKQARRIRLS
ncbi:hypothetical protein JG687_00005907 [Phytophthora cactorum]|uniref:Uncharacterized protein n=1 Tax=Phytophthora cactorum TaxID=29920 RepID=A0A8T1UP49_9STRA|nr:hypothetical protein JG687_00005907 [Phytophthora cactorum]